MPKSRVWAVLNTKFISDTASQSIMGGVQVLHIEDGSENDGLNDLLNEKWLGTFSAKSGGSRCGLSDLTPRLYPDPVGQCDTA